MTTVFDALPGRIGQHIMPEPNSGCWLWDGRVGQDGRPTAGHHGGTNLVHRIIFAAVHDGAPSDIGLSPKCGVRICVNPDHMMASRRFNSERAALGPRAHHALAERARRASDIGYRDRYNAYKKTWYARNRDRVIEKSRQRRLADPAAAKEGEFQRKLKKFGLTSESYAALLKAQNGLCKTCGERRPLMLDHDHKSGVLRGLLCQRCNIAVGYMEAPENLITAWRNYLNITTPEEIGPIG